MMMQRPEKLIPLSPAASPSQASMPSPISVPLDQLAEINSNLAKIAEFLQKLDARVSNLEAVTRAIAETQAMQLGGRASAPPPRIHSADFGAAAAAAAATDVAGSTSSSVGSQMAANIGIGESPLQSPSIPVPVPQNQRDWPSLLESPHERGSLAPVSPPPNPLDPNAVAAATAAAAVSRLAVARSQGRPIAVSPSPPAQQATTPQEPFWTAVFSGERRQAQHAQYASHFDMRSLPTSGPQPFAPMYPAANYATTTIGNLPKLH
eukprot:m51a1_g7887 hypothetical protein (264) ;mRNA; r:72954-74264